MSAAQRKVAAGRVARPPRRLGGWLLCLALLPAGGALGGEDADPAPSMELLEFLGSWDDDQGEWLETLDLFLPFEHPDESADEPVDEPTTLGDGSADDD